MSPVARWGRRLAVVAAALSVALCPGPTAEVQGKTGSAGLAADTRTPVGSPAPVAAGRAATTAQPLHLILVMDGSAAMAGAPSRWMKEGALRLVGGLHTRRGAWIGVVRYDTRASQLCPFTQDLARLTVCIKRIGAWGGSRLDLGVALAWRMLIHGRALHEAAREAMVVFSGSRPPRQAVLPTPPAAASQVDIMMQVICLRPGCDPDYARQLASAPLLFHQVSEPRQVVGAFDRVLVLLFARPRTLFVPLVAVGRD